MATWFVAQEGAVVVGGRPQRVDVGVKKGAVDVVHGETVNAPVGGKTSGRRRQTCCGARGSRKEGKTNTPYVRVPHWRTPDASEKQTAIFPT